MLSTPKKTFGGEELAVYLPPILFPLIGRHRDLDDQRMYVMGEIEKMARNGTLCVTDMLAQPARIRDLCGRIIKGLRVNPETMRQENTDPLPPDVLGYVVRVKCCGDAKTVKFKHGVARDPRFTRNLGPNLGVGNSGNEWSSTMVKMVDEVWDYGTPEAEMDLATAWICLGSYGKFCRRAKLSTQHKYWLFEEIDKDGNPMINHTHDPVEDAPAVKGPRKQLG